MHIDIRDLQRRLAALGHYTDRIDGVAGQNTAHAIIAFNRSLGLPARAHISRQMWNELVRRTTSTSPQAKPSVMPPHVNEIRDVEGLHEKRDNAKLKAWLRSDGASVGDPAQIAWCGDAVETAIRLAYPGIDVPTNPYWARNWQSWGVDSGPVYGAVASFERGRGGHVGFAVGKSQDGKLLRILGGNQSNQINEVWKAVSKPDASLLGLRMPAEFPKHLWRPLPVLDASGAVLSVNEA